MPYFTSEHLRRSLQYLADHAHPQLLSLLAMFRERIPISDADEDAQPFGAREENVLLSDYFKPAGGPEDRAFYLPFAFGQGEANSPWRDYLYASRSLQRMRKDRTRSNIAMRQSTLDGKRWRLRRDLAADLISYAKDTVGSVPLALPMLAIWLYRTRPFDSAAAAVEEVVREFNLQSYGLVGAVFSSQVPSDIASLPMRPTPLEPAEILQLLKPPPTGRKDSVEAEPEIDQPGPDEEEPGRWDITVAQLGDLGGLIGLENTALQALAALRSGMHVIFTGAPGTGKTSLAVHICERAGFPTWTASATDQWTTFDTIGGYFPAVQADSTGEQLDFLAGHVVDTIERKHCLIIDEINRADIDKAFGELFTLLSGQSVTLPFRRRDANNTLRRIRLTWGPTLPDADFAVIEVPAWWRILGAMNDADKQSLKQLSYAFMRRFAFISVPLPPPAGYEALLRKMAPPSLPAGFLDTLISLFADEARGFSAAGLAFGPAIPLTMLRHAGEHATIDPDVSSQRLLREVLEAYVIPQFQGRADLHEQALDLLREPLGDQSHLFERRLAVWTGFMASSVATE